MRARVTCVAAVVVLGACLAACGDGRRAELQIVVHARSVPVFGGRVQGILYPAVAVRWNIDVVEIGGRPCRLTGVVIGIHNPEWGDSTRAYTAATLFVPTDIPAYGRLHLDHAGWLSIEDYVNPPRISPANSLVLDFAVHFKDRGEERVATVTVGPSMPME
jgi:hypothetical protein